MTVIAPLPVLAEGTADSAWNEIEKLARDLSTPSVDGLSYAEAVKAGENSLAFWKWYERHRRSIRSRIVEFWRQFPSDPRRFEGLIITATTSPFYWKDVEQGAKAYANGAPGLAVLDLEAKAQWEARYVKWRTEFMMAPETEGRPRASLRSSELSAVASRLRDLRSADRDPFETPVTKEIYAKLRNLLIHDIWDLSVEYPKYFYASGPAGTLLKALERDRAGEAALLAGMSTSPHADIQSMARAHVRVMQMRQKPVDLKFPTLAGKEVDLAKLRGKVVFVDIWSNYCYACIKMMPKVQAIYAKYRDRDFEVVGIWLDTDLSGSSDGVKERAAREKARAIEILEAQGVTYPNALVTGQALENFSRKYYVYAVPVTWLFDQSGLLVTTDLRGPRLDSEVRSLLGL